MKTEPAIGQTVYWVSPNLTINDGVVTRVNPPYTSPWSTRVSQLIQVRRPKAKYDHSIHLTELDPDPAVPARVVLGKVRAKHALAEKRLARWTKTLAKVEAYLPPEERTL